MRTTPVRRLFAALFAALAALSLAACQELVGGDDRREPVGLVVVDARGTEVAVFSTAGATVSGGVTVPPGSTRSFQVYLTDRSGGRISIDGVRYTLHAQAVISHLATASSPGTGEVTVTGRVAGNTSLVLSVLDAGAAVFPTAVYVPLAVRAG